jgi:small subunit ribosomal protein S21
MRKQHKEIKGNYIEVKDGNVNSALRKFKKKVDESGILLEVVRRQTYEKPTTVKKRKKALAKSRWKKKLRDQELPKKLY